MLFNNNKKEKKGEPIKITIVNSDQFNAKRTSISNENNLVRCPKCGKLISKYSEDGKTLQNRGLRAIIYGKVEVECVDCGTAVQF